MEVDQNRFMDSDARLTRERVTRIEERCGYIQGDIKEIKETLKDMENQRDDDRKRNLQYIMALAVPLALALIFAIVNIIIDKGQPL